MISSALMICTGNICRSPIAEALLRAHAEKAGRKLEVASAGVAALVGKPADAEAVALMAERNVDITNHRAQQITMPLARHYELILVMEASQKAYLEERWPSLRGRIHALCGAAEDVPDPYGQPRQAFEHSLEYIEKGLKAWTKRLWH
ncbi:MAG TPA: low molecular weight protein-tyrosine-phosphatase [Gammaproteobacteria bacterium]|nr:low molecular weight protein-tyrosine-phosphatase [Gammaproteobacteria bacterium]